MTKKEIREKFRNDVFKRDKYTCKVCNQKSNIENLDAHHIIDRGDIINGGYVKENGITVCKIDCHFKVEMFHIYEGEQWEPNLHPDDLYKLIGSSKELAIKKSEEL
jgi:5-methylcytosine-specific restriction endonuclease McrA